MEICSICGRILSGNESDRNMSEGAVYSGVAYAPPCERCRKEMRALDSASWAQKLVLERRQN